MAQEKLLYKDPHSPVEKRVADLLGRMTLTEKLEMVGGYHEFSVRPNEKLGIPEVKMSDGPVGVRNYGEATAFPAGICMAATWDTALQKEIGKAMGIECRSKGVHIILGPGVNIHRLQVCGRNFEYFGEDPYLASRMAVAYIEGVQSEGVCATVKHFAANNQERKRFTISADVDERTLREIYLPVFRAAVEEAHVGAVMAAYNKVNGVYCAHSAHLIKDILKGDWKFDGFIMSDWGGTWDGVAAANAGLDLEMPSGKHMNVESLTQAIESGKVAVSAIDDKARRILRVLFRFGFFDRPQETRSLPLCNPDSRLKTLEGAREGIVLLKNQKRMLPFDRHKIRSISVIGPNASPAVTGGGGSSRVQPFRSVGILDGIIQAFGNGVKVYYADGLSTLLADLPEKSEFSTTDEKQQGLLGEYFDKMNPEGKPVFTRIDRKIDFDWTDGPSENFRKTEYSVRWTGKIRAPEPGVYDFVVRGDDGFRLFVDNRLLIDAWRDQSATTKSAQKFLHGSSAHEIRLEYYQNLGDAEIRFGWGKAEVKVHPEATKIARFADAAVVCVGFSPSLEGEGYDRPFALPAGHDDLINEVVKANPRTVVVINAGGNVDMSKWIDKVPVLLYAWYPGQEGGAAVAEILSGEVNPSGKLPVTLEKKLEDNPGFQDYASSFKTEQVKYSEGIFVGYRHFDKTGIRPRFPFGFGLSYTTFKYSGLRLSAEKMREDQKLDVRCSVTNAGKRAGAEVVQLYVSNLDASVPVPVKELKGFKKVYLRPGQSKQVRFRIDKSALSFFDVTRNAWTAQPGKYDVLIGSSSEDIRLTKTFRLVQWERRQE